jgi:hypothetical protein
VERPPTGQAGGEGSSPELLNDGKGGKTGTTAAFSDVVGAPLAGGVRGGVREGGGGRTMAVARSDRGTALGQ